MLDHQEQYSIRNCLLVHGVKEKDNAGTDQEIIKIVKNELGEEITIHDIDRTHHLGKRKLDNNVPRPIVLNLQGTTFAIEFLKVKRNLKEKLSALRKV